MSGGGWAESKKLIWTRLDLYTYWAEKKAQGLKKPSKAAGLCRTAEAVPFVQRSFLSFSALAVAHEPLFAR
jgi:hypothetical protein